MALSSAVNFSEGRRSDVIDALRAAAAGHVRVLDVSPDVDHNRTVITLCGEPPGLIDGIVAAGAAAVELIDLGVHDGVHPRLGSIDVVPFTPRPGTLPSVAVEAALECAGRLWSRLVVPCFLYEQSARVAGAAALPFIRREAFRSLYPDIGGPEPHPTAGAAVVGGRGPLIAFNVNLATGDIASAREIASRIRSGPRSLPFVRSLGIPLRSRNRAQVSMNITRPDLCSVWEAFVCVQSLAGEMGVEVESSELVGVIERAHLGTPEPELLLLREKARTFD